jgi:signal transduction histidine kinase
VTRSSGSIERRLTIRLGVLFAIVFLAGALMMFVRYRDGNAEPPMEMLNKRIQQVAMALVRDDDGTVRLTLPAKAMKHIDYVVRGPDGTLLLASSAAAAERLAPPPNSGWDRGEYQDLDGANGDTLFSTFARVTTPVGPVIIQVAESETQIAAQARSVFDELLEDAMPLLLPFVLATLIIGVRTIRNSLSPLGMLAAQAAKITPTSTELRLPDADLPRELQPLVAAINGALNRLDAGFRQQREFTADAAHELRTPLAILAAHLDSMGNPQAVAALREDVDRMSRLVGQLLSVAQLEALAVAPDETADLHAIAVDVAASLAPIAVRQGKAIAVTGAADPVAVRGNADALRQAIRNLVENAMQHTPAGSSVEIDVSGQPAVHVVDHGAGVPETLRTRVVERFWRGDRRKGDGAGLGLAIVNRIAAAHGGRLAIGDTPGGGARFSLYLQMVG